MNTPSQIEVDQTRTVAVDGFLSLNWAPPTSMPAVIVNPEAHPLAVLSWCLGELYSLRQVVIAITSCPEPIEPCHVADMVLHRMEPLPAVLEVAFEGLNRLHAEQVGGPAP